MVTLGLSGYLDMTLRVQQNCLVSMRHLLAGGWLPRGCHSTLQWVPSKENARREKGKEESLEK